MSAVSDLEHKDQAGTEYNKMHIAYLSHRDSRDSSVGIATGCIAGVLIETKGKILFYSTKSRPALGPTEPPILWVPWALSPSGKTAVA
jgi:hypothetical protein